MNYYVEKQFQLAESSREADFFEFSHSAKSTAAIVIRSRCFIKSPATTTITAWLGNRMALGTFHVGTDEYRCLGGPAVLTTRRFSLLGYLFSDIETNEKPIPIRRQAVPDRPRRNIQKQMKFRFELTNSWLPVNGLMNTCSSTSIT